LRAALLNPVPCANHPGLWFDDGVTIRYYGTVQNTQNSAYKFEFEFIWNNKRAADVTLIKEELLAVFYTSNVVVPSSWFQYDMFRKWSVASACLLRHARISSVL